MAYFSNSSDSVLFDDQCVKCKMYMRNCPIAVAQLGYNYDQANNVNLEGVLSLLVDDKTGCQMFIRAGKILEADEDEKNQMELFQNENPQGL